MDHLQLELSDRLLDVEDRMQAQLLISSNTSKLTDLHVEKIYNTFEHDLPATDREEFYAEIRRWQTR